MKVPALFFLLFTSLICNSQSLPIDFESSVTTNDFIDFDGGVATVIANPQSTGINNSSMVAQIVRDGGQIFAGSKIELDANLDFTTMNIISIKVFTSAPIGTNVKLKLEGEASTERDVQTTVSDQWEVLEWDFTGEPSIFNNVVFMFDFGNIGDGSSTSTFLFDDVEQINGGTQIDLPVDFEGTTVNYTLTDFEGNSSFLTVDPTNPNNTVVQAMKTNEASPSAGTTIGTPAGFATDIPLSLTSSKMNVRVWSPAAGTPIRLKVEDSNDVTHTCETETNTTVAGDWETIEFDFLNEAPGTELLSIGLANGWTYNKASIFFNFATGGSAENEIYYFDDIKFGEAVLSNNSTELDKLNIFPNPTNSHWNISADNSIISQVDIYDVKGALILSVYPDHNNTIIDGESLQTGIYFAKINTDSGVRIMKLMKE